MANTMSRPPPGTRPRSRDELPPQPVKHCRADVARIEAAMLGTILDHWPDSVPPTIARLIVGAPESFDDLRHGLTALAMRQLEEAGEPVNILTVAKWLNDKHPKFLMPGDFLRDLLLSKVPLEAAESEAGLVWNMFRQRRLAVIGEDMTKALDAAPDEADSIIAHSRAELDAIEGDATDDRLTLRRPDELLVMTFENSDCYLGDRLLAAGQNLTLVGPSGVGKSRLLLQLAVAARAGKPFVGIETNCEGKRWLILQAENSNRRLQADLKALAQWVGNDWPRVCEGVRIHTLETERDALVQLDDAGAVERIERAIADAEPDIVAFDALYNFGIGDLNTDADMRATLLTLSRIARKRNPERAIDVLHHALTGRAGAAKAAGYDRSSYGRNSKVLHAWTRAQINVAPGSPDDNAVLVISCGKNNNGKEFSPFAVRLNPQTMIYEVDPGFDLAAWARGVSGKDTTGPLMTPERTRDLCKGPMSKGDLAKAIMDDCGCYRGSAYRYLANAEKAKTIKFDSKNETYCPDDCLRFVSGFSQETRRRMSPVSAAFKGGDGDNNSPQRQATEP